MSVTGKNVRKILAETGENDIFKVKVSDLKKEFKFFSIEDDDKWKVDMIEELVNVKQGSAQIEGEDGENMLTTSEMNDIISYVSTCFVIDL